MNNIALMLARLTQDAEKLAGARGLPIDVLSLLTDLGLGLRIESGTRNRRAGGLRRLDVGWEVLVVRNDHNSLRLTPRERFTIAHEIGHYFVAARFAFKPGSNREYWALEDLCNDFARSLLAPREALVRVLKHEPTSAKDLAEMTESLSELTQLSLEPAARRITAELRRKVFVSFLEIDLHHSEDTTPRVLWTVQNHPWGPKGRRKKLSPADPLAAAASTARELRHREGTEFSLSTTSNAWVQRRGRYAMVTGLISHPVDDTAATAS
ncbi:MAG: ImmA/IrrE family metallo-endopeptidase [bacterium]